MNEVFQTFFDAMVRQATEWAEGDGVPHFVILMKDRPGKLEVSTFEFDRLLVEVEARRAKKNAQASHGDDKRLVYHAIANVAKEVGATGYVEMSEGWMIATPNEEDYKKVVRQYGSLEHAPLRLEVMFVRGRFKQDRLFKTWKIRRRDKATWLEPWLDTEDSTMCGENSAPLDEAINAVCSG